MVPRRPHDGKTRTTWLHVGSTLLHEFSQRNGNMAQTQVQHNSKIPTLSELAADYRRRGDGCVTLYGRVVRVTHPLSSFGMESHTADGSSSS